MNRYIFIATTVLFCLNACSDVSWLGHKDKPKHLGVRESFLKVDGDLKLSKKIAQIKLPKPQVNIAWLTTSINQNLLLPENIVLAESDTNNNLQKIKLRKYSATTKHNIPPIIFKEIIFTYSNFVVSAHNLSGQLIWQQNLMNTIDKTQSYGGGMILVSDILYIATGSYNVIAINVVNGKIIWQRKLSNVTRSVPYFHAGLIFVTTIDNKLYAIKAKDGGLAWMHQGSNEHISFTKYPSVVARNGLVIAPYTNGNMHILSMADGQELRSIDLADNNITGQGFAINGINITPIINDSDIYAMNSEGVLIAFDIKLGLIKWRLEMINYNNMWISGNYLFVANENGEVTAIDKDKGKLKWLSQLPKIKNEKYYNPIMVNGNLLFASNKGKLIWISAKNGELVKRDDIKKEILNYPIVVDKTLYLTGKNGIIYRWR